jgi:hypothetical protein
LRTWDQALRPGLNVDIGHALSPIVSVRQFRDILAVPAKSDDLVSEGMFTVRPNGFIEPCIPTRALKPPVGPDWVHEIEHDG